MASKEGCQTLVLNFLSASLDLNENAEAFKLSDLKTRSFDSIKKEDIETKGEKKINRRHVRKRNKRMRNASGLMTTIRGGEISRRKQCRKVDVRYAKEFTKFINKYSNFHSSRKCPKLTERLTRHRSDCPRQLSASTSKDLREREIIVAPSKSQTRIHSSGCKPPPVDIGSQTHITLSDNIDVPLKKCATRVIEPKRNIYKDHLKKEIIDWFRNIPIFYSLDFTAKYLKDNIAVMLLENINNLANQKCKENYEGLVQKQIDDCLNILPMWLPNSKQDQCLFKNNLKDKLYKRIKELNLIFLETEFNNENVIKNEVISDNDENESELYVDKYDYMKEVSDWLDKIKFSVPIPTDDITDYIIKRISPILNNRRTRSCKMKLQEKIKEVLEQLPVHLDYAEYKDVNMYRFAEDLATRLFNIPKQVDTKHIFGTNKNPENIKYGNQIIKSPPYSEQTKQAILENICKILKEAKLENGYDVVIEMCDMIIKSLENTQPSIHVTSELYEIISKKCLVTPDKAKAIAKKIEATIQIVLKQNTEADINNQLFGVMSVYRSNSNNFMTSTPKKQKHVTELNPDETSYVEKVASLVRALMETIPNNHNNDKSFKETVIYDFAEDIMNEKKREQTSLQSDVEKDKNFIDFVKKSFAKFNIFDNPKDVAPFIKVLLEKLKLIPVPNFITYDHHPRQIINNSINFGEELEWDEYVIPKSVDVLKEQILVWVNKQPAKIYAKNDVSKRYEMIKQLALSLQAHFTNNMPEEVIDNDIKKWLHKIIRPEDKKRIGLLTVSLKASLTNFPQSTRLDTTINKNPEFGIVEFIEEWCDQLPIDTEVSIKIAMKADIAKSLYQKIGEFGMDPTVFKDENLYKDLLVDELDTIFENLPQNPELLKNSANLKAEFISNILELKKAMEQKFAGANYKHKLENTLNASLPNPIQIQDFIEPGFEIYKNYLAKMFILDNFDHSNEDVKSKYERRIKYEIDKYFDSAQKNNALLLSKEQMYNELYSVLFKVSMPNEESMIDEVEEVKTRCEIDAWFESLPLEAVDDVIVMLEWDLMLSTLTKRIHNLEKNESEPDQKIHLEINKFLQKLPLSPEKKSHNNIDEYISKLQTALKSSAEARKYVAIDRISQKGKTISKNKNNVCGRNISQIPGPSSNGIKELGSHSPKNATISNYILPTSYKNPADQIEDIVNNWCNKLPWIGEQLEYEKIKNDASTKIVIKIFEMNMDPDIFNDDIVYDQLLDEELDDMISSLKPYCDFGPAKLASKYQLKGMIKFIKPLIKEDRYKFEYKTRLNELVENLLNDHNKTAANIAEFHKLKDDIVDNFIQYTYNKNYDDIKQIHKTNIHDAVIRYNSNVKNKGEQVSSLVRLNQLLCELSKIPMPSEIAMKEEVEEMKMKNEVEQLFKENNIDDHTEKTEQMKKTLTKTLNDIEKSGHTELNDSKMNADITKCLNKLGKKLSPQVIQNFVNKLKNNEVDRKNSLLNNVTENNEIKPIIPNDRDIFTDLVSPLGTVPNFTGGRHTGGLIPETKLQQGFSHIPAAENGLCRKHKDKENEIPICNQDIRYHKPSDFQLYTPGLESLQPPADYVQYLPATGKDFHTTPVCRSFGQNVDTQSANIRSRVIEGSSKPNLNESWNIYRPEVINQRQNSCNYENVDDKTNMNPSMTFIEYQGSQNQSLNCQQQKLPDSATSSRIQNLPCRRSIHRPLRLSRRVSNNPSICSPDLLYERAVPMTLKRGSKPSQHMESFDERHRCTCVFKNKCKRKRYCMIPVDEYCDECGGYRPRWCRVLMPRCSYLNF